jgi:hypothetical protein
VIAALPWVVAFAAAQTPAPPPSTFDYSAVSPTAAQIDGYLARKRSPMSGLGESFSRLGQEYNVDPRLVVAIAGAETTFGGHVCAERNAWNWFYRRNCPQSPFPTYEAGLERVAKFMRLSYINRGYDSIELIRYKYCAAGCENWIPLVTTFYREMPSNSMAAPPAPVSNPAITPSNPPVTPSTSPDPSVPQARQGARIFGLPPFVLFFAAALIVAAWASRALRRS